MVMGLAGTQKRGWARLVLGDVFPSSRLVGGVRTRGATGHNNGPPCGYPLVAADLTVSLVNPIDCEEVSC